MAFIHSEFISAARRFAGRPAVCWEPGNRLTYGELDSRSNSLARLLTGRGVGRGERVGVMLPRTGEAIVAIFAALKSGAAYVPIDPGWPADRVTKVLRDSCLKVLVAGDPADGMDSLVGSVVSPDSDEWKQCMEDKGAMAPDVAVGGDDLAYILYTSGSTGTPKGVCISHRAAAYFANWARERFSLCDGDRIAALAPFTFDLSTFDLFSGLSSGAEVHLVGDKTKMLPPLLSKFMQDHRITVLYAVPSTLVLMLARGMLARRDFSGMRLILFAGEVFPPAHLKAMMELLPNGIEWFNLFGPTETNVCLYCHVPHGSVKESPVPIGEPLPGTELLVLPAGDEVAGAVERGELCVAGDGVMSGYWGREDDDARLWLDAPTMPHGRAYRTGDIVEKGGDGRWHYLGRKDGMVKIWGYRVELGDIETCLLEYPGIEQAVAVKVETDLAGGELAGFVIRKPEDRSGDFDEKGILKHCRTRLPRYMIPRNVFEVESVPLTHSGKVDRRKLEGMVLAARDRESTGQGG
ncbi:MAG: D-alanine--poly(phosphoribitol) ligase [Verrucomicrobia bacterium]|nr:D-alanine--poly(phosphoribitol) ligase [Verrucomicrobiota bacterium]